MEANLAELGSIRQRLNTELESLKTDSDRAAREARSLGYLRKNETELVLGERSERVKPVDMGRILPFAEPIALGDLALKEIALGAALAVLALLFAPPRGSSRRRRGAG